ncbi:hypothetical protein ACFOY2_46240 [Nonomuraea purpurea]|uniref:Uncharacterized protein n=1 Tax=Nonomuraea purpurea TaxID=1849276 RepID=A0ABV8GNZ8_9ACTN
MPPFHTRAYDEVLHAADDEAAAIGRDPRAWLTQTPLILALTDAATPYIARHRQPKHHLRAVPLTADRYLHSV